ncbi:MAG: response regulator, partial [Candidatus Riflebacteria bacterium]|nr:response regulator [Candidatus Riflebacteria bacterium]
YPIGTFGRLEAQRHRERGIDLTMFLGLFKYYRRAYHDLIASAGFDQPLERRCRLFADTAFDRIELGFCAEWAGLSGDSALRELQETTRRMTNEKNRYLTLFESLSSPAILLGADHKIENLNLAASRLLKRPGTPGQTYYEESAAPMEVPEWLTQPLARFQEGGTYRLTIDKELPKSAGGGFHRLGFSRMLDVSGKFSGTLVLLDDLSDRKRAEAAVVKSARMEVASTLASGIAHDFNNLMQAILGNAELLGLDLADHPGAQGMLSLICNAAEQGGQLAQQMLAYARGGKRDPRLISINDTVQEAVRLQARHCPSKIQVECDLDRDAHKVNADPSQLSQVVMHLLLNAVEAISGAGKIAVSTRNITISKEDSVRLRFQPGAYVCLTVRDTGCGMPPEVLSKVFEPFFSTKGQGRGLGLAAAFGIVAGHDGRITVQSTAGQGTTFRVYLAAAFARPVPVVSPERRPAGGETILLIDDDEGVLEVVNQGLRRFGYVVLVAPSGQKAVELAKSWTGRIDLAILDMEMPGLGGLAAFPLLTQARPAMKILICSGNAFDESAQALLDGGAGGFLQKPLRLEALVTELRRVLDGLPPTGAPLLVPLGPGEDPPE